MSTWFKGGIKRGPGIQNKRKTGVKRKRCEDEDLKTRSVMFVDYTRGGEMAKKLRLELGKMENLMGFRMKVIERTGTRLKDLFSPNNVWKGSKCEREDCTTCNQGGKIHQIAQGEVLYMKAFVSNVTLGRWVQVL